MEDAIITSAIDVMLPVIESSQIIAGAYAKACGRNTLTACDLRYAMRYSVINVTGRGVGSLFPDIYTDSDSDEDDIETVDEDDEPFTRYSGDDKLMNDINEAHDSWDTWVPCTPAEILLKSSVNKVHDL